MQMVANMVANNIVGQGLAHLVWNMHGGWVQSTLRNVNEVNRWVWTAHRCEWVHLCFSLQVTLVTTLPTAGTSPPRSATLYAWKTDWFVVVALQEAVKITMSERNDAVSKGVHLDRENFGSTLTSFLTYFHQLCPFHVCVWGRKRDIKEPSNSLLYTLMSASMVYQNDIARLHRRNRERAVTVMGGQLLDRLDYLMSGFNTQDPSPDDLSAWIFF